MVSYRYFLNQIYTSSNNQLDLYSQTILSKLFELRPLNKILSNNPAVLKTLKSPNDKNQISEINNILLKSKHISSASEIYLLDETGLTLASSNWQNEGSFVGNNYGFRPYFTQAIDGLSGQYYAVGTRSNIRGYYFSEPIYDGQKIIGVLVLKAAIDELENIIKRNKQKLMILDNFGIVFLSNDPNYLYKKTRSLSAQESKYLDETRRYNDKPIGELTIEPLPNNKLNIVQLHSDNEDNNYLKIDLGMPLIGWNLVNLIDENEIINPSILTSIIFTLIFSSLLFIWIAIRTRQKLQSEQIVFKNQQASELERRVEKRSLELKQVQDEMVQTAKLAALGQMSAAISHELSQPLTSISNYIENAKIYLQNNNTNKVEKNISHIAKLTDKMAAIIHHTKIFASKRPTEIEKISINEVIEEAIWFMQSKFQTREVRLEMSVPKKHVFILANSVRIEQVLLNLMSNALESMQKSDVKILNIEMSNNDDLVKIIIRDTGEGIDEASIEKIFKPFYTTKDDEHGMGIGLSISRSIIEEYDGMLEAFNRPTGGARFEIELPIYSK